MKKLFTFFAAATIFAACSSNSDLDAQKDVIVTDTTGMYKSNYSTDVAEVTEEEKAPVAPARVIRETRVVYVDRTPKAQKVVREAIPVEPVVTPVPQSQTQTQGSGTTDNTGTVSTGTGTDMPTPTAEPVKKEKEGWSKATKGAVIGGVGGAVAGAILSKKKGKGAIIGGVIGAAGGYILGRKKDKADEAANEYANYTSN